jgi:hypothetical protein
MDVDCRRYSTWREAEQGHDEIVKKTFVAAKSDHDGRRGHAGA